MLDRVWKLTDFTEPADGFLVRCGKLVLFMLAVMLGGAAAFFAVYGLWNFVPFGQFLLGMAAGMAMLVLLVVCAANMDDDDGE